MDNMKHRTRIQVKNKTTMVQILDGRRTIESLDNRGEFSSNDITSCL